MKASKFKTSTIIAASLAVGIVAGASVTAVAALQKNMQLALASLQQAEGYLQKANDNKGGHRRKAMDLVAVAIREVKLGIQAGNN